MMRLKRRWIATLSSASALVMGSAIPCAANAAPAAAPVTATADPVDSRIAALLGAMSLEHKVAQLIQPDISTVTPDDVRRYRFGSVLNGGNSGPGGNDKAPAKDWLALADSLWAASTTPLDAGEPAVPLLWATDAVHGHSNIPGATLFPHNVALGAAGDAGLVRAIGAATAAEIAVTGIDWAFAPTVAVARDARWGRTYESFSENPELTARLGAAMIEGLQGPVGTGAFLDQRHVIATAKHFLGDGGTGGIDRGDTRGDPAALLKVHALPYRAAVAAGTQTVMASFSAVNGIAMHGNSALLTGLLRGEMGFGGVVVGDWNGHATVPGCINSDCPRALLAGLDIFMVPEDWRALYTNTLAEVRAGTIPMARLDEAVGRVLRLKARYGLFDKPRPAARALAGHWGELGSAAHRAIAREAVARSLVLLKNNGVLPLRANAHVLVAGKAADSVPRQSGGWSISWQGGGDLTNADFPGATSIYAGIAEALRASGGEAVLAVDGTFARRPDAAVVVFGEEPYAEFVGDRPDHALRDEEGLGLLRRLHAAHVPTVAVLLSGRPLWTAREMALADAFVAAWLPGSEGGGVADVLVGDAAGKPRREFTGRLPFHWPASCADDGVALWPFGAGGSYAAPPRPGGQIATCAAAGNQGPIMLFDRALGPGASAVVRQAGTERPLPNLVGGQGAVTVTTFDARAQEDGRRISWGAAADLLLRLGQPVPVTGRQLELTFATEPGASPRVTLAADCAGCTRSLALPAADPNVPSVPAKTPWQTVRVALGCLAPQQFSGLRLSAEAPATVRLLSARIILDNAPAACPPP